MNGRENIRLSRVSIINLGENALEAIPQTDDGARRALRHVTSRQVTIAHVSRKSSVWRYCFALCVDARLYQPGLCYVRTGLHVCTYVCCCIQRSTTHVVPFRWIGAAQMQFQRFRWATSKSRCSVTKMYIGLFKFNLFNGISIPARFRYFRREFARFTIIPGMDRTKVKEDRDWWITRCRDKSTHTCDSLSQFRQLRTDTKRNAYNSLLIILKWFKSNY